MSGLCYAPRCQNSVAGLLLLEPADKIVDSKTSSVSFNPGVVLANAQARFAGRFCFMPTGSNFVGKHPHNWKGGRTVTQHGYVLIYVGKNHPLADCRGYAYEHRLRAWAAGKDIQNKLVHHEDEIKSNNQDANLIPLTHQEHHVAHRKSDSNLRLIDEDNLEIACECGCGVTFLKFDSANRPRRFLAGHNLRRLHG